MLRSSPVLVRWLMLVCVMLGTAAADAPTGYKCGPGGRKVKEACACPKGKVSARDADNKAICAPKPPPVATACLKDRAGKHAVKIDSQPQGATIFLGDKSCGAVGQTPWTGKLEPGPVNVILERHSYVPHTRTFDVVAQARQVLSVPLVRTNVGTVRILADADPNVRGADVRIDGEAKGKVPLELAVPGGRRKLELDRAGFASFTQWIDVEDAVTVTVMPVLVPQTVVTGKLFVDADVPGAEVHVNGTRRGTTPVVIDNLPEGDYEVLVEKPPATPFKATVRVAKGQTSVRALLASSIPAKPTTGTLRVVSGKIVGSVYIDGLAVGNTPLEKQLPAGEYWVVVRAKNFGSFERRVQLAAGQTVIVDAMLHPSAKLVINSAPAGAAVFVDGKRAGVTPLTLDLLVGEHAIIVERQGFQRHTVKVQLKGDQTLDITLQR